MSTPLSPAEILRRARDHTAHAREFEASAMSLDFVAKRLPAVVLAELEKERTTDALRERFELELSRSRRPEDAVARVVEAFVGKLNDAISAVAVETRVQASNANGQASALLELAKEVIRASMLPVSEEPPQTPPG